MHKKLIFIITIFFSSPVFIVGQNDLCGTPDEVLTQKSKNLLNESKLLPTELCVNIRFHILRNSSGVNAIPVSQINLILNDLNYAFNKYNIFFKNVGVNYIQNDTYFNINDIGDDEGLTEFNDLISLNDNDPNAVNIYIVNDFDSFGGRAQRLGNSAVIASNTVLTTTNVHEIGHNFGLLHTHSIASGIENIERSGNNKNCDSIGDGFCSTPADPNLLNELVDPSVYKVDASCNYTAGETRNGLPYNPDTSNFMSYSRRYCRNSFTQEQGDFMNLMIQTNNVLQNTISSSCAIPTIIGSRSECEDTNIIFTIQNPPSSFTWSVSNNLQIVSSNSTSVTVKADVGSSPGFGTIYANYYNGAQASKQFSIEGQPRPYTLESNGTKNYQGGGYFFLQSFYGTESFSVFTESPETTLSWSGPSDLNWWNTNNHTVEFYPTQTGNYIFTATATNDCGSRPYFVSVQIGNSGGPDPMFSVAPNPVQTNTLVVKDTSLDSKNSSNINSTADTPSEDVTLTLYDFNGHVVQTQTLQRGSAGKEYRLNVSGLKNQNYFLKITCGTIAETYQIILNK